MEHSYQTDEIYQNFEIDDSMIIYDDWTKFSKDVTLEEFSNYGFKIPLGHREYQFSFDLPFNLTPSFLYRNGRTVMLAYYIRAQYIPESSSDWYIAGDKISKFFG